MPPIKSPFFIKKEKTDLFLTTDLNSIKNLQNVEYFNWLNKLIIRDPNRWNHIYTPIDTTNQHLWPANFVKTYNLLKFIRSKIISPVDTMGSSSIPINVATKCGVDMTRIPPNFYRFQILISCMLSSQTKDEMTALAMLNLTKYCLEINNANNEEEFFGITPHLIGMIPVNKLDQLINCVGFHNRKATYIHNTTVNIINNFDNDIPTTMDGIMSLQGVGIKMATLVMQYGWGQINSICVDIHVHRLSNLLNWTNKDVCKNPNLTRLELQNWLPHELWGEINSLLVGIGQFIDRSRQNRLNLIANLDPVKDFSLIEVINHMNNYQQFITYIKKLIKHDIIQDLVHQDQNSDEIKIKQEIDTLTPEDDLIKDEQHLITVKQEDTTTEQDKTSFVDNLVKEETLPSIKLEPIKHEQIITQEPSFESRLTNSEYRK